MKKVLIILGVHIGILMSVGCTSTTTVTHQTPPPSQQQTVTPEPQDDTQLAFDVRSYGSIQLAMSAAMKLVNDPNNTVPHDEIVFQLTDACVGYMTEARPYLTAMAMAAPNMPTAEYDKHEYIVTRTRELYVGNLALLEDFVVFGGKQASSDFDSNLQTYGEVMSGCITLAMADAKFLNLLNQVQAEYLKDKQGI
ncbi:hypothetical protein ACRXCV_00315 (plasmid) [Halobacteriovorax sp. GFR7]|uniref:hypothetical protein n=1 Tax=unclassified Halobacteriovorax TaxID=2639665 RepID=UPI003D96C87A